MISYSARGAISRCSIIARIVIVLAALTLNSELHAQREWNIWYGGGVGVDFNDSIPRLFFADSSAEYALADAGEGYATISDRTTGHLLLYSSGKTVWNRFDRRMPNGIGLLAVGSPWQPVVIVPDPGSEFRYYLFTTSGAETQGQPGYCYSIVDMRLDSGRGDVERKNIQLRPGSSEAIAALRHCNGRDFWVVTNPRRGVWETYRVTAQGVTTTPVTSPSGFPWWSDVVEVSPDGSRLAASVGNSVYLLQIDNSTGLVTPQFSLSVGSRFSWVAGLSFSPDNSKLYVAGAWGCGLMQFDLSAGDSSAVNASRVCLDSAFRQHGSVQAAANGKIYVSATWQRFAFSVINRPNEAGVACDYEAAGFDLGGRPGDWPFPNIIDAYAVNSARCLPPTSRAVSADTSICAGAVIRYADSSARAERWHWIFDGGVPATFDGPTPPPVRYASAGTYTTTLITSNANGEDTCTVDVTVHPLPVADAGPDLAMCESSSVQLAGRGGGSYRWRPSGGLSCDTCANTVARPDSTTTYELTVISEVGCVARDSIIVVVAPLPIVDAGADTAICSGAEVTLGATGAASYRWTPEAGLSCLDCPDPVAGPSQTSTYIVTGTSSEGCTAIDSVTVVVNEPPALVLEGDSIVCRGSPARVTARGAGSYRWRSSDGVICDTCAVQTITAGSTLTLYVEGLSQAGCATLDSFVVRVVEPPSLQVTAAAEVCRGGSVALGAAGATSYAWSPSDGLSCTDCAGPVATPSASTLYTIVGRNARGCADTATVSVTVSEPVAVRAELERGVLIAPGDAGILTARTDASFESDSIAVSLAWHRGTIDVEDVRPSFELRNSGWSSMIVSRSASSIDALLVHDGSATIAAGDLFEADVRAYLSDSLATEVVMECSVSATSCSRMTSADGQVVLDSICGLSVRLIETGAGELVLRASAPNPVSDRATISFSVPFDGHAVLALVDARGVAVLSLIDSYLSSGAHAAELDAHELPSGIYELRLSAAGLTVQSRLVIVR